MNGLGLCGIISILLYTLFCNFQLLLLFIGFLLGYISLSVLYLRGPASRFNSIRRKVMISTWGDPTSSDLLTTISAQTENTSSFLSEVSQKTGVNITLNHLAIKALGETCKKFPCFNGRIVLGSFRQYTSVNLTCQIEIQDKAPEMIYLKDIGNKSLVEIAREFSQLAEKASLSPTPRTAFKWIPTPIGGIIVEVMSYLTCALGYDYNNLGFPKNESMAVLTDLGKYEVDVCYAPFQCNLRTPLVVNIGPTLNTPVVRDGEVSVGKMTNFMFTVDQRYGDPGQASMAQSIFRDVIENPRKYAS